MCAFLFPGQGSQMPGMGQSFHQEEVARPIFSIAAELLGDDFLPTLFEGREERLRNTAVAQPALVTVSLAIAATLESRGLRPTVCAGHSVGEFAALAVSGAITPRDAIYLAQERGYCMATHTAAGSMAAVLGLDPETIEKNLPSGVEIANYNGPSQTIISGTLEGLEAAYIVLKEAGAKRVLPLNVSGPFHSSLASQAQEAFISILHEIEILKPEYPFISSVTGQAEHDPAIIRDILARQICAPVCWTRVMQTLGPIQALEVGPGNVLTGLARRTPDAPILTPIGALDALNTLLEESP